MFEAIVKHIRSLYNNTDSFVPLHEPRFIGNEKKYVNECIDSSYVSSIGEFVNKFEREIAEYTGAKYAIATVNGTAALHIALLMAGVGSEDEVITQPLTFIATVNAISYTGARAIFVDIDKDTLGLSPEKLEHFLVHNTEIIGNKCINKQSKKVIRAIVPMHTFGIPLKIEEIVALCSKYYINVVEDATESLGSFYKNKHTGTFGLLGTFSFNGNKIITTGGGGMIVTNNKALAKKAKHITTTAKISHRWHYRHDEIAYNYRLPNINAALGCAQLEMLPEFIVKKRVLAQNYQKFFEKKPFHFITELTDAKSNYWLNTILLKDKEERDLFLKETNDQQVMTRPVWQLINTLPMYKMLQTGDLENALWIEERAVNVPSSIILT